MYLYLLAYVVKEIRYVGEVMEVHVIDILLEEFRPFAYVVTSLTLNAYRILRTHRNRFQSVLHCSCRNDQRLVTEEFLALRLVDRTVARVRHDYSIPEIVVLVKVFGKEIRRNYAAVEILKVL